MNKSFSIEELIEGILADNRPVLSKAITLAESTLEEHSLKINQVLEKIIPHTGKSLRIGITGIPGVGKSTLIEELGLYLIEKGKKVAVLAVDPSSDVSKGSILGDKTRMESLATKKNAFIRPTPAGDKLGGIAKRTYETILLCEAAGFDVILIETVGVGQSETMVYDITDLFLFLQLPNMGDDLQGIKRGIMERADIIFINKVDKQNQNLAKQLKTNLINAIQFLPKKENSWKIKIIEGSALENIGIKELWELIEGYFVFIKENKTFEEKREAQLLENCKNYLMDNLFYQLNQLQLFKEKQAQILEKVRNKKIIPYHQINQLVKEIFNK